MPTSDDKLIERLNALIMLAQWNRKLPLYAARLFARPEQYNSAIALLRAADKRKPVPPTPGDALTQDDWQQLYQVAADSDSVRALFANSDDPFAGAEAEEILQLAEVADLTTDRKKTFSTRNGTFQQVLEAVRQQAELNTKDQINDGLFKFYSFLDTDESMTMRLHQLAGSTDWYPVLASLADGRDYASEEGPETKKKMDDWNGDLTPDLRQILLAPTKLFRVPKKLVRVAWERRDLFEEAKAEITPNQQATKYDLRQQIANAAYQLFVKKEKQRLDEIVADLQVLATVARQYLNARKFVKLDGLVYTWPKIAALAMANYPALRVVEKFFTQKPPPSDSELDEQDARQLFDLCKDDDALIRFFRLQPYFREIDENELRRYRAIAPVTTSSTDAAATKSMPSPEPAGAATTAPVSVVSPRLVCELVIKNLSTESADKQPSDREYEVTLNVDGLQKGSAKTAFSVRDLLKRMLGVLGASSEESLQPVLKELFAGTNAETLLLHAGANLEKAILRKTALGTLIESQILTNSLVRFVITSDDEDIHYLPWEWLPRPGTPDLMLINERFSLVRSVSTLPDEVVSRLPMPLRILGIFPNAPVGGRDWSETSARSLEAVTSNGAYYVSLLGSDATLKRIEEEAKKNQPDVAHFEGFVAFKGDPAYGAAELMVLLSHENSAAPVALSQFMKVLRDNGVKLVVIGKNEMSRVYGNAGPVFAGQLTRMLIPAVLAPMHAVDDVTSTTLTTEFYRAFLEGNSLEHALFLARRKCASSGGDWTSYALFANPSVLDLFQPFASAS